ncbi:MAG TPA: carbohydrate ABC transporter permease [Thermomicrobiales bacterium]|nr:carbohydrate ABC transporter permease [Thermomicrobiales bacterium]
MSSNYERTAGSRNRLDPWSIAGWVFLILLLLFTVIPMLWMISTSFKTQLGALQFPLKWIPTNPTLDNYTRLLDPGSDLGRTFLRYMGNSLFVSTATTIIGVAVAVPAAYAFSRFRFPGKNALFYGVLLRNMFPAVIFLIPLFIFMRNLHLVNSYWSLIITYLTFGLPLSIWLLKGFYDNIPVQLEQAARIDGASRFQAFVRIVMPLSAPGIVATAIYSFILAWNEYVYALTFINDQDKLTVPVGLQRFFTEYVANWPGLMAAAFLMSVPVVVMFLVLQKYFVRALTEGAVKQ